MKREEIEKTLRAKDSTILSFPQRSPTGTSWGDNKYRGNCSGWIQAFCIWKYQVKKMAELFSGGGTGSDVAKDMGIRYIGADLNPNPVRNDILSVNAITDDVPQEFLDADFYFMHPPYSNICRINWAGSAYPDPTGELAKQDLGCMPWDKFMKTLNSIIMKYYAAMMNGGKMGILMGDVRRSGIFKSMMAELVTPGIIEQIIIKEQNNTSSGYKNVAYSGHRNFVPIAHEYLMIIKKTLPYMIEFSTQVKRQIDIRDAKDPTWRDIVYAALHHLGGESDLTEIYAEIDGHKRCQMNPNWKAKIRQVLQQFDCFQSSQRGEWRLVAM